MPSFAGCCEKECIEGKPMAKKKHKKTPNNKAELIRDWVWCPAGSGTMSQRRKWVHYKTCRFRQGISPNDCMASCRWYRAISKLEDPNERKIKNLTECIIQDDEKLIKTELGNKRKLKKYMKSIPKE